MGTSDLEISDPRTDHLSHNYILSLFDIYLLNLHLYYMEFYYISINIFILIFKKKKIYSKKCNAKKIDLNNLFVCGYTVYIYIQYLCVYAVYI